MSWNLVAGVRMAMQLWFDFRAMRSQLRSPGASRTRRQISGGTHTSQRGEATACLYIAPID